LLKVLEKIAFYQPRPTVALVRLTLEHRRRAHAGRDARTVIHPNDEDVRDAAAPVLRTAAYNDESLPEAGELLWEMARGDARPPHQHPNHALRMLAELAAYDPRGVSTFQQALPALVERWLRRPRGESDIRDPLSVLHPLLATEGHQETWSRDALIFRPFPINPDAPAVIELRQQALDLAFAELASSDLRRAAAAVEAIATGLQGPIGKFRRRVTEQERASWTPHFMRILRRLRDAVRANPPSPAIAVALRARLQRDAEHVASGIHQAARAVLADLPRTPEYELARALRGGPIDPPADSATAGDFMGRHRATERFFADCVAALADRPDDQVVALMERLFEELGLALGDVAGRARSFLWTIVTTRPSLGAALCNRVRETTDSSLVSLVSITIVALGQVRDPHLIDLARRLLETEDVRVAREIARGIGIQRARTDLLDGEDGLLRTLVET
jgi:hypothetical protein